MTALPLLLSRTCLLTGTGAGGIFSEFSWASAKMDMAERRVVTGLCFTVLASSIEIKEVTMGIR